MSTSTDSFPVVCRQQQIEILSSLLGSSDGIALPSLFIYGHTATGKSVAIKYVLRKATSRCRCDNTNDFIRQLQLMFTEKDLKDKSVYIILERAERLREMDSCLLPSFLRLQELTGLNVGVIMESEIVWEKFRLGCGFPDPYVVHFPNYNKDELLEIVSRDAPTSVPADVYRNYANLLLSVFHVVCRNLNELRRLAVINFSTYMEPVRKGDATLDDTHKLWRHLEPHLKKALQTVYLHEVSGARWEQMHQAGSEGSLSANAVSARALVELPVYSKYLVIAAYLASYNPPKSDRRFFSKNAGKMSKRMKAAKQKNERKCCHLLGPKIFPLDRLMAIFYAVAGSVPASANIYVQITSLVTLGLLIQVNASEVLETPKFKCLVSLDFVKSISRSVNFEVLRYLWDFI